MSDARTEAGEIGVADANDSIVITGVGLLTPLGLGAQATWAAVRAGQCGMGALSAMEQPLPPGSTGGQVPDLPPTFEGLEEELASLPGSYAPPLGQLFLARHAGQPAGCVALKPAGPAAGELKRLYVRPLFRGLNLGGQLVAAVIQAARQAGYQRLVLDSHKSMSHAHALYRAAGFRDVEPPPDFPAALRPVVVFMQLTLA